MPSKDLHPEAIAELVALFEGFEMLAAVLNVRVAELRQWAEGSARPPAHTCSRLADLGNAGALTKPYLMAQTRFNGVGRRPGGSTMADQQKIRATLKEGQAAPVPLRVAASLVYFQISGKRAAKDDHELDQALNDAAFALAQIADIYYENDKSHVLRIPDDDLYAGSFEGGAKTFKTASGQAYTALSMRRIDVMYAVEVLEKAHGALHAADPRAILPAPGGAPSSETAGNGSGNR